MYSKFELKPIDNRKSFYGKCYVEVVGNVATLYSYNTKIMSYNTTTKEIIKYGAYNYSTTTRRHQRAFAAHYGIELS